ncbi:hypothetical protein SAMN02744102_01656 [Paenibacillus barengoltzii]|nr:hypothetical protein SAMN02744102_01656 [Paenibacillus barengoltzii]
MMMVRPCLEGAYFFLLGGGGISAGVLYTIIPFAQMAGRGMFGRVFSMIIPFVQMLKSYMLCVVCSHVSLVL